MSAKFLHALTDENPELKKQSGCMTGFLQMFDRQHLITGRQHGHRKLTSGRALSTSASPQAEQGVSSPPLVLEKNLSKSSSENKRISMESSRTSFSSSSCSSFSSIDGHKTTQPEALSLDGTIFLDKYSKNSPRMMNSNSDGQPPRCETQIARRTLDFRDVVKDSINRDTHSLSVRTSPKQEAKNYVLKRLDSPRSMQRSKSMDGSHVIANDGKSRDRVLVKLEEPSWNFSEYGESPRSSFEAKDHRLSYDGGEISRQSLDSRDNAKLNFKLQELPRLSLDSRKDSMRNSIFEPKMNTNLKGLDRRDSSPRVSTASILQQELVSHRRSSSVVTKLMGLEAMPSLSIVTQDPVHLRDFQDNKEDRISRSPKRSLNDPVTPRIKDPASITKPVSNSRVPIETAPWKQRRVPQKEKFKQLEAPVKQQTESVFSEIEKRLKDLEFQQSKKDLRALKQILDAMQAKGLLGANKNDQKTRDYKKNMPSPSTLMRGTRIQGTFESPIVIMKPANSVKRSDALDGLSSVKLLSRAAMDKKKACTISRVAKELSDKKIRNGTEGNGSSKVQLRTMQASSRPQQSPGENGGCSLKTSNSLSPRLQQKMLEAEKSRPPLRSSDSSKPRRISSNGAPLESVSPRGNFRQKQNSDGRLSNGSETRNFCYQNDEISLRLDRNISLGLELDTEVTSAYHSSDRSSTFQQGSRSPSARAARKAVATEKQKKTSICSRPELATATPEQPSPISVLDASFHQDDLPPSPLKKISNIPEDEKNQTSDDYSWTKNSTSEINKKKLRSINNLVQRLKELSSTKDEFSTTDHIASLCETQNPNHRYVSEILLASGLLFRDLSSRSMGPTPIKLHTSGHPINPDLFLVLEQTKTKSETLNKTHRKLVFDMVNEILIKKLELTGSVYPIKLVHKLPSGQQLLKELCIEIEKLQAEQLVENSDDEIKISEGWGHFNNEVPGIVLEIERSIFKDMIDEVVSGEVVSCTQQRKSTRRRRQLFDK